MSELKRGLFPRRKKKRPESGDPVNGESSKLSKARKKLSRRKSQKPKRKKKRILTLAVLPTMLTLGNAVCGLAAISIAVSTQLEWAPEFQLFVAGLLIFGGMLFDALDGSAARMTGQASKFGAELDSLCDAVTFGVAPAVIIWQINDALPSRLIWGIGVLFTLCVLIRLARFNVETGEDDTHEGFEGLPSPAAAGTVAAFAIAMPQLKSISADTTYHEYIQWLAERSLVASQFFIPCMALVLAYLMVSRFQYPHVFQQWVRGRRALHQIGQALFALFGVFILDWIALPVVFTYFALASPTKSLLISQRDKWASDSVEAPPAGQEPQAKEDSGSAESDASKVSNEPADSGKEGPSIKR